MNEHQTESKKLPTVATMAAPNRQNRISSGPCGLQLLQDIWFMEKLVNFDCDVIPERRMHARSSGTFGTFTSTSTFAVTRDISKYSRAKVFYLHHAAQREPHPRCALQVRIIAGADPEKVAGNPFDVRQIGAHGDGNNDPPDASQLVVPVNQQVLYEQIAHSLMGAPQSIQMRHISNCMKANKAWGMGVARALGVCLSQVELRSP